MNALLKKYLLMRIILFPIIVFSVVTINFVLIHSAPGGPFQILLSDPTFSKQEVLQLEAQYGLNRPLYQQYAIYIYQVFHGNLGISYFYGVPVLQVIGDYLPNTLVLAGLSLLLASVVGILLGVMAAMSGRYVDKSLNVAAIGAYTTPVFWQGLMMLLIFSVYLHALPSTGVYIPVSGFNLLDYGSHILLPVISLSLLLFPPVYFFTRSSLLEVMGRDFIKALRGKGLGEHIVFMRHALRNALLPVITLIGLQSAILFGGATIVEIVFTWPGIGLLTYTAILNKDYPVMLGSIFFYGILVASLNLAVDLIYVRIDPRIVLK